MALPRITVVERVLVEGRTIGLSLHACERYRERCRPALAEDDAPADLVRVARACGSTTPDPPEWLNTREPDDYTMAAELWLMLGADIAFPLAWDGKRLAALTCLARGNVSDKVRESRSRSRRSNARLRKTVRQVEPARRKMGVGRRGAGARKNRHAA